MFLIWVFCNFKIINYLKFYLKRLNIENGWVCEFGSWDGKHLSNTFNLIENKNFNAVFIEGDKNKYKDLLKTVKELEFFCKFLQLSCLHLLIFFNETSLENYNRYIKSCIVNDVNKIITI